MSENSYEKCDVEARIQYRWGKVGERHAHNGAYPLVRCVVVMTIWCAVTSIHGTHDGLHEHGGVVPLDVAVCCADGRPL